MKRKLTAVYVAAVVMLMMTSCSSNADTPTDAPTTSPAVTATESPAPTETEQPATTETEQPTTTETEQPESTETEAEELSEQEQRQEDDMSRFENMSGNPIISSIFTADPSARVWDDGRIYIYASHDIFPSRGCDLMDKYHVFSSDNMVDWIDEGEILRADDVSWGREEGGFMWAPDCMYRDGTYYFYFPHPSEAEWNNSWKIGVATSSEPASGFTDQGYIQGLPEESFIDPNILKDDDGSYYLYGGGGGRCYGARLNDDMMSIDGEIVEFTELEDFHEGVWVFKRDDVYYMTYPDNNPGANRMRYATSDSPFGPWENKGIFLDSVKDSETSHGSVVEYKGNWYLFYHNAEISSNGTLRSVCVDQLFFNDDGTIQMVNQTEEGVPAIGPRSEQTPATEQKYYDIKAEKYDEFTVSTTYSINSDNCIVGNGATKGGSVENMHIADSFCEFTGIDGGNGGKALLTVTYASADSGAAFKVEASGDPTIDDSNSGDGYFLRLPGTGNWGLFTGSAKVIVDLLPGSDNIIRLNGGMGGVNIASITVSLMP